ncbi:Rtf2 RING-finger-domain-containing protein [Xylariaceae sp. FL1272]|nr:Rtf2 RING-finger-domain-containing protein [Xylariaceae sp. FL1272]
MGNDGGSIPKRRELVKEAARLPTSSELKATALESLQHSWSVCPISSTPLDLNNTCSDYRGRLYNYETILRNLMPTDVSPEDEKSIETAEFQRTGIKSLKDVVKVRFNVRKDRKGEVPVCPLSMKELGPATKACYVVPCGHVFAEAGMRELIAAESGPGSDPKSNGDNPEKKDKKRACAECSEIFVDRDIIPVLPVDEQDIEKCTARIEELRALGLAHNLKKEKSASGKKKKRKADEETNGDMEGEKKEKKVRKDKEGIESRINNSMTASLTAKVLAEQDELSRRRKMGAAASVR